jgi:4-amino-4-deoxy-L-arabinose transferase-like glycosyltransferase
LLERPTFLILLFMRAPLPYMSQLRLRDHSVNFALLLLAGISFALFLNFLNLSILYPSLSPRELFAFGSYPSPDDVWYRPQVVYFLQGFGYTLDPADLIYSVRRTPIYPLWYGLHYYVFGVDLANVAIVYSQLALFAVSSCLLYLLLAGLTNSRTLALVVSLLYVCNPFLTQFTFFTMTEGIYVSLTVLMLFCLFKAAELGSLRLAALCGFLIALIFLARPSAVLLLMSPVLLLLLRDQFPRYNLKICLLVFAGVLAVWTPWIVRNYIKTGLFVPLETYYLNGSFEDQGPKQSSLGRWEQSWTDSNALPFHFRVKDLVIRQDWVELDSFLDQYISQIPSSAFKGYSNVDVKHAMLAYADCVRELREINGGRRIRFGESPPSCEYDVALRFDKFREDLAAESPHLPYLVAPSTRLYKYIFHSAVHGYAGFQDHKGSLLSFAIKSMSYVNNVFIYLAFFLSLFYLRFRLAVFLGVVPLTTLGYLILFMHVEDRYMAVAFPFFYLAIALAILKFSKRLNAARSDVMIPARG